MPLAGGPQSFPLLTPVWQMWGEWELAALESRGRDLRVALAGLRPAPWARNAARRKAPCPWERGVQFCTEAGGCADPQRPRLGAQEERMSPPTARCLEHRSRSGKEAGPTPEALFHTGESPTPFFRKVIFLCVPLASATAGLTGKLRTVARTKDGPRSFAHLPSLRIDGVSHVSSEGPAPHTRIREQPGKCADSRGQPRPGRGGRGLSLTPQVGGLHIHRCVSPRLPHTALAGTVSHPIDSARAWTIRMLGWKLALICTSETPRGGRCAAKVANQHSDPVLLRFNGRAEPGRS